METKMYCDSGTASDILGVNPSELTGLSVEEITDLIRKVQQGVLGDKLTDEQIEDAAQKIYEDAHASELGSWVEVFNGEETYDTPSCQEAISKIVEFAGLSDDYAKADGETFETVLREAAKRLGVNLNI